MKVEWQPLAEKGLIEIVTYIAEDNLQAVFNVFEEIKQQITMLAEHPQFGSYCRCRLASPLSSGQIDQIHP